MSQQSRESFVNTLGWWVAALWLLACLVSLVGLGMMSGVLTALDEWTPFEQSSPPTPGYPPLSGLAYISPQAQDCTLLKPKSHLGFPLELDYWDFDYTVCAGLEVEILASAWVKRGSSWCYLYLVRVPGTRNVSGWIVQDELSPFLPETEFFPSPRFAWGCRAKNSVS
ncbi:MAG: hypothetical protein JW850_14125 [Thermoflexales bacterium]|nr:hypothetical protein [Thermoflexales bacterium]